MTGSPAASLRIEPSLLEWQRTRRSQRSRQALALFVIAALSVLSPHGDARSTFPL